MSNQAKRLSDCPAERLAQCRGEAVPAAGNVEVLGRVMGAGYDSQNRTVMLEIGNGDFPFARKIDTGTELVEREHVTRLQAEVSALQQRLNIADQRVCDLENELKTELDRVRADRDALLEAGADLL